MRKRNWFIMVLAILAAGLGYAGYFMFTHSSADTLTVSELRSQTRYLDRALRVEGRITPGSIDWDNQAQIMKFVLTDDKESLSIVYQGVVPDTFRPGADLVVEGKYRPDGTFEALNLGRERSLCNVCH